MTVHGTMAHTLYFKEADARFLFNVFLSVVSYVTVLLLVVSPKSKPQTCHSSEIHRLLIEWKLKKKPHKRKPNKKLLHAVIVLIYKLYQINSNLVLNCSKKFSKPKNTESA